MNEFKSLTVRMFSFDKFDHNNKSAGVNFRPEDTKPIILAPQGSHLLRYICAHAWPRSVWPPTVQPDDDWDHEVFTAHHLVHIHLTFADTHLLIWGNMVRFLRASGQDYLLPKFGISLHLFCTILRNSGCFSCVRCIKRFCIKTIE